MKPPLGPGSRRRLFLGWGVPEASPEGWSGRFRHNDELQEHRARPPPRAVSRAPAPAPVVACVEAYYGSRRGAVVRARDVSLETETELKNTQRGLGAPLPDVGQGCLAGGCAGAASPSARLLSRGEADLPSAAA